jgi:3-hydroxyisobutyrate dehydrogenase
MGANMARRLNDQHFTVTAISDVNAEAAKSLADELGSTYYEKLSHVTKNADVIITVVTDDKSMKGIFHGTGSLLARAHGKLFINCATVSPSTHVKVEEWANKHEAQTLEACMASSITQAREGTLYLMCGGKQEAFDRAKPILDALSVTNKYIGDTGSAAKLKALVNMVMNINTAGLAEGLGLADAMGLDLTTVREVFSQTGANSRVLETDGEDMVIKDHECYFSADHAAKDSGIALKLGEGEDLKLPLAKATWKQYEKMKELGLGELDKSGVAELTFKGRTLHS